ncbi:RNA-directed DNA polymerase [Tanacetum coccineum]
MTRNSTKELITPFENPERVFAGLKGGLLAPGLVESSSPELNLFSDIKEHLEEETTEIMMEKIENEPSSSITNWETLKMKFLNKYCPPARTAKKMEEINNFQQEPDENLFRAWERFKELLMKWPGFYQCNNGNSLYPDRRQTLEESLTKFIAELAKRHEENSNIIKEIRASTDAAIRNQGASIKTLEIQIGQMSKVLQERGTGGLPGSTEPNPRDHVKSISTAKANSSAICRIGSGPYAVLDAQYNSLSSETVLFPSRLHGYYCDDWKEAHVFKRKITLRVGEEKLVFKSIEPATSIIRRVYMVKERTDLDSKTEFVGEAINESFDPLYGNYIELNDLDMPLEPRMNQDDFEPTLDFINEPAYKSCYKMKFSCMIGYRHVNVDFLPSLSINIMTKHFYNSIIKDKGDHEGKNLAGTLIDIPIFVGNFSIILGFSITDDVDITSGVVLGMPFCKKFVSCQKIIERFAHGDECERMDE